MKICFITDGGRQMGMGHVQQSTTLANRLRTKANVSFLTKSDESVQNKIRELGFETTHCKDDAEILQRLTAINADTVIFDKIDVDEGLACKIKKDLKSRLIIFTNLTGANRYADVAVLQRAADLKVSAEKRFENITYTDKNTHTIHYYGPKYWILRPEFLRYQDKGKVPLREPKRILLIFGGSDPTNLTSWILQELLKMGRDFDIDIIIGSHFSHDAALEQALQLNHGKNGAVTIYRNTHKVAELMYQADLAITSAGLSMFEALCVGTPIIVIPQDDLQKNTYQGFIRMLESSHLGQLEDMIKKADFTYPHDDPIVRMKIGQGVEELEKEILLPPKGDIE